MLHEFSLAERGNILTLCSNKIMRLADSRSSSEEMERGLPLFYDELIEVLHADADADEFGEALKAIAFAKRVPPHTAPTCRFARP